MPVVDRGVVEDALTTPTPLECLASNRRGMLSPRQLQKLMVYRTAMVDMPPQGFALSFNAHNHVEPTLADLDADMQAGLVQPVDGVVEWVRGHDLRSHAGAWCLCTADGRKFPLNGQSLPGATRGYVLPRFRLVVGIEPVAPKPQALDTYQRILDVAFGLTDADHQANAEGHVGPHQRSFVRSGSHGVLGVLLLVVGGVLLTATLAPTSALGPGSPLASWEGKLPFALLGLFVLSVATALLVQSYVAAPGGRVRFVDGVITRAVAWSKSYDVGETTRETTFNETIAAPLRRGYLNVGNVTFDAQHLVDAGAFSTIVLGLPHRVWFEEKTRAIVAVAPLPPAQSPASTA